MNIRPISFSMIFALLFLSFELLAQSQEIDVVYLKNGKTITGKIIERIPDKTIVIETKDGIEFVDYVDIKRIQKEFIPKITSLSSTNAEVGTILSINGSFPASQPQNASVLIGEMTAEIVQWRKEKIDVRVPLIEPKEYPITVHIGNQSDVARIAITISGRRELIRQQQKSTPPVVEDAGYDPGGMWVMFGYAMPTKEYGMTEGFNSTSSYAKAGFSVGFEGRVPLSENLYMPINFQVANLGYNIDELKNQTSVPVSSTNKVNGLIWLTGGLGFAVYLSPESFLFASGDYGLAMVHRPDTKFGTTNSVEFTSTNTFTGGYGFSAGITFAGSFTIGYRIFSAKPKHKIEVLISGDSEPRQIEVEQPASIGMIYLSF
ncbi:MAG: IPT/TIG domain-containing protein [Bacteroidota bacterium]